MSEQPKKKKIMREGADSVEAVDIPTASSHESQAQEKPWYNRNYCGCCGREACGKWCVDCQKHVAHDPRPDFERTYFALNGNDCPFAVENDHV